MTKPLTLIEVENFMADVADCTYGDLKSKLKIKKYLMDIIVTSCRTYVQDDNFHDQVENYINRKFTK